MGVFSSWVTALMKLSCCSLRRISRTRKIVFRMMPAAIAQKKINPRKTLTPSCQLRMIHPLPTASAVPASPTPSVRKKAIVLRREVMRIEGYRGDCISREIKAVKACGSLPIDLCLHPAFSIARLANYSAVALETAEVKPITPVARSMSKLDFFVNQNDPTFGVVRGGRL